MSKLNGFPTVYYLSLEEDIDRRTDLVKQFNEYEVTNVNGIISKRYIECNDILNGTFLHTIDDGAKGCFTSHMRAIKKWLNKTDESIAFFCEDDLSLKTVNYWNFTWNEFVSSLPEDWDCVQLLLVRDEITNIKFRERYWDDWSATAYIVKREYAKKLIDTYHPNDEFYLDIPETSRYAHLQPIIENVLYSFGNVYAFPLFVEEVEKFNCSHVADENFNGLRGGMELVNGQASSHNSSYYKILNWWKENQNTSLKNLMKTQRTLLEDYVYDTENAEKNYNLAKWYEEQGHVTSAHTYYLRAAERSQDNDIAYSALIRASFCYKAQGARDLTEKGLLENALVLLPERPEAYYFLSLIYEKKQEWQNCYIFSNFGLECYKNKIDDIDIPEFGGKHLLIYQKSVSSWWWGKGEESRNLIIELCKNYWDKLDEHYKKLVIDSIGKYGVFQKIFKE